jgi:hypothetical protein
LAAVVGLTMVISASPCFARGRYGGGGARVSSGAYGSVRQSSYHSSVDATARGGSVAAAGDNRAGYAREVTGPGGRTASSSGRAVYNDGQAVWNREVTGPGGNSATVSGGASVDDGHVTATRQVTGPNGRTATTQGEAVRVGSSVTVLPAGHYTTRVGDATYYYHEGYYYQPVYVNDTCTYSVIPPPLGVVVYVLPEGATPKVINGVGYYTIDGTYYRAVYVNGQVAYTVVAPPQDEC